MDIHERIRPFLQLPAWLRALPEHAWSDLAETARIHNPWFTEEQVRLAFEGLFRFFEPEKMIRWLSPYVPNDGPAREVGLVMAGNIPMVGFHDLLCVLLSGHRAQVKLSSQDNILIPYLVRQLSEIEPDMGDKVRWVERLSGYDAVIATGSDNSARYFEYYFAPVPHIIRRNRTSIAVLRGDESTADLSELASDVFQYFGLGCRNVSKIFVPEGYDLPSMLPAFERYRHLIDHHKYANNYFYRKSVFGVNRTPHLDSGYFLLQETDQLFSPIAVVYAGRYDTMENLSEAIRSQHDKIQCLLSRDGWYPGSSDFGTAQLPEVWEYADGADTMAFLSKIGRSG
jgi:hypothetical protein